MVSSFMATVSSTTRRRHSRLAMLRGALGVSLIVGLTRPAAAQAISTATIRGAVRSGTGVNVDGASVRVRNTGTGFTAATTVVRGHFLVQGLEVGGPYVVELRRIGFVPQRSEPLFLRLGEPLEVQFVLQPASTQLDPVVVAETRAQASVHGSAGAATIVADSLLRRLPTLDRSFLDFTQLAPQVSGKVGSQRSGISGAGANLRFNNFLINGDDERFISTSVSPAQAGGKSIPIDAVKEYQVLVAPYDIRYGDFAGALVNTVSQSGTNELRGSAFGYWRDDRLARNGSNAPDSLRYERMQYGFSLGGPIVRDRLHFFVAPEIQRLVSPVPGPHLGQFSTATPPVPVRETDVARFGTIMQQYGLSAGSGGAVQNSNPLRNLFARVDGSIPRWNTRVIGFVTYADIEASQLSRSALDTFNLSSYQQSSVSEVRLTSLQLHTDLPRYPGAHNELHVSLGSDRVDQVPSVREPLIHVLVPGTSGGTVAVNAGANEQAQGRQRRDDDIKVKDELTLMWGSRHVGVFGIEDEHFRIRPSGVVGGYGTWSFASLDSLAGGLADRYELRIDEGSASAELRGEQFGAYVGDEWRPADRLSLTFGVRADFLRVNERAPFNAAIDSLFGRRTDEMPRTRPQFSPRVGFVFDMPGAPGQRLRGGAGVFAGRPPLAWIHPALLNYGVGIGHLVCSSSPGDNGAPPVFNPDYRHAPTTCAGGGAATTTRGDVDLLDRNLRMAQSLRASLAYERRLPWNVTSTTELLVTRYRSDFMFVNLNLVGPQATDRFGRVMYGSIDTTGIASPATRTNRFTEIIDLRNTSRNHATQLTTRIERQFARGFAAVGSYTYSQVRDVQSPSRVNQTGLSMWGDARALSGRHDDLTPGISLNDVPHRVVAAFTYATPRRWPTELSFYYVGESGSPFTYRAGGTGRRADLNADGSSANDPIYVPRSAFDTLEVRFAGVVDSVGADNSLPVRATRVHEQQVAFEDFIRRTPCLERQRGRIASRNSCREPWSHTTIAAIRQTFPFAGRALEAELDVFNWLNALNAAWGRYRVADPRLLEHVGQTPGLAGMTQPIFRFDATRPDWTTLDTESAFQLQLAMRYRF